jgi:hypothetical protein
MTPAGWSRGRRGIEADVVEQVFVALGREAAQFAGESLGLYLYRFRPMLPVVDPTNAMSLSGALLLDRSGVPVLVKADDRSGTTVWQATLGDFGRAGPVDVPFVPALTVQAAPLPRTGCCGMSAAVTGLRSRLDALGWRYRLTAGRGLALSLDQALMRSDLALLLGAGRVELWRGRAVEAPDAGGASDSLVAVAGDVARWVRLTRFIARNAEFDPLADVGMPSAPRLVVAGSVNAADSGDVAVLLIDGTAVASCRAQADGTLSFQDVGGPMTVRIMAVVCRLKPLPVGFAVATRG